MENRKFIISQSLTMLLGQSVLSAVMVLIFALLGYYDRSVLLGAAAGALLATANHTILILSVVYATGKAGNQDVKGGQAAIQLSYMGRLVGLFLVLVLCAKSGIFHLLALVIPLLFTRPILAITDHFISKKGGANL